MFERCIQHFEEYNDIVGDGCPLNLASMTRVLNAYMLTANSVAVTLVNLQPGRGSSGAGMRPEGQDRHEAVRKRTGIQRDQERWRS